MSLLLVKAVALSTAVLLALPTGWCCGGWPFHDRAAADAPAACPACARHAAADADSSRGSASSDSQSDCNCDLQTAALIKQQSRPLAGDADAFPAAQTSLALFLPVAVDGPAAVLDGTGDRASPRLHVLKCVWRC